MLLKELRTVQSISRKYRVMGSSAAAKCGNIYGSLFFGGHRLRGRERRHACHAPDLSRRAADVHEAPDTSDNNLFRSDSAGTMPPPRIADPARYVIGCCSCCFSRRAFFLSLFLPFSRTPFLLSRCSSYLCDTTRFLPTLHKS